MKKVIKIVLTVLRFIIYSLLAPVLALLATHALNIDDYAPVFYILILSAFVFIELWFIEKWD